MYFVAPCLIHTRNDLETMLDKAMGEESEYTVATFLSTRTHLFQSG